MRERLSVCIRERKEEAECVFVCEKASENGREGEIINSWHWGREAQLSVRRETHTHTNDFVQINSAPCVQIKELYFAFKFRSTYLSILLFSSSYSFCLLMKLSISVVWWQSAALKGIPREWRERIKEETSFINALMKTSVCLRGVWYYIWTPAAAARRDRQSWWVIVCNRESCSLC